MARPDVDDEEPRHRRRRGSRGGRGGRKQRSLSDREPLLIRVLVHDLRKDETIRELTTNINDADARKWLLRVMLWAFREHHSVELLTAEDDNNERNPAPGPR